MACQNCGHSIRVRKSLGLDKSDQPDDCPECGAELAKSDDQTLLQKNADD